MSTKMWSRWDTFTLYLLVAPALILWVLFSLYPSLGNFYYCFFRTNGVPGTPVEFVGLQNFAWALSVDLEYTVNALLNGFRFVLMVAIPQNILALLIAVLVGRNLRGKELYRAIFFFPQVVGSMVIAMVWSLLLQPNGPINELFRAIGYPSMAKVWLGDVTWSFFAVSAVQIWVSTGYAMVIYIAGLQGIPDEIYEAAVLDGANSWQRFWRITLPLLMPAVTINTLLSVTGCLGLFDMPYLLTQGGPLHTTETMPLLVFDKFLGGQHGYGSALAVLMFFIVAIIALVQTSILRRMEVEM